MRISQSEADMIDKTTASLSNWIGVRIKVHLLEEGEEAMKYNLI